MEEISTEKNLVYVFSKKEYQGKSSKDILQFIKDKTHPDYKTIYLVKKILEKYDAEVMFINWEGIHNIDLKRTKLLVIPQEMMIGGKLKNTKHFIEELYKAQKHQSDFIFLHHHPYYLKDFISIEPIYELGFYKAHFRDTVIDVIINDEESELTRGISEVLKLSSSYKDEFTYKEMMGSNFKSIIEKVPSHDLARKGNDDNYIMFGYNKSNNGSYSFLIDIHATGAKRGPNGKLFQLLFENTLNFIFNKKIQSTLNEEEIIKQINSSNLTTTEKKQLVDSRIGQGIFREKLIKHWGGCAVTGFKRINLLRASHIKPWKVSSNNERLDLFNGLLLIPNIDTVFDLGLITFDSMGKIIISSRLSKTDIELLGIKKDMKIKVNRSHLKYLKFHNEKVYKG